MTKQIQSRLRDKTGGIWVKSVVPIVFGLGLTSLIMLAVRADPILVYSTLWNGAFGNPTKFGYVLDAWIPLTLCSVGLLITFTAGLWNIGIEGQIVIGAVFAAWTARTFDLPPVLLIPFVLSMGMLGGAVWGLLAGVLKVFGRVHEIFGGLGLNFVAFGFALYLILGPWKRTGIASTSGTDPFPPTAWLPDLSGLTVGFLEITLAGISLVVVHVALRNTLWGLKLKAIGRNIRSAFRLGISTHTHLLAALMLSGALAGLTGAEQAIGVWHRLIPAISGGYGYLSILIVVLSGFQISGIPLIAFFFAAVAKGSVALPLDLQLDSALGGVMQGMITLLAVLSRGVAARFQLNPDRRE